MGELPDLAVMALGAGGSFAGSFAAIKVHINYLTKHNDNQDARLTALEAKQEVTDRKADRAHLRLDHLTDGKTA